jgi:hypothetical protein
MASRAFSCAQRTFPTSSFPHAHHFVVVRNGEGEQGAGSAWHPCGTRECPHEDFHPGETQDEPINMMIETRKDQVRELSSRGWSQGCRHWIRVPHGTGGIKTTLRSGSELHAH